MTQLHSQVSNNSNTFANLIFVSGMEQSGFPETLNLTWVSGKSYLIPETTILVLAKVLNREVNFNVLNRRSEYLKLMETGKH
ncbi:hypothetical protein QUF74_14140 [Candidatus Halobeggiatoa sp. HSG11]|nr:hypothetical protein [Candidatus Halobeggiatoa sp. HSG11]